MVIHYLEHGARDTALLYSTYHLISLLDSSSLEGGDDGFLLPQHLAVPKTQ